MTIGPRTLKALEDGPKREYMGGGHCTWTESHRDFARRVALIAVEEALRSAADELGVPQPGYLAPVANAADILRAALAKGKP